MTKQITYNELKAINHKDDIDIDYRHDHPAIKSLERHLMHAIKHSAINYQVIMTINGYKLINVGIVLVNKSIMEAII